jgi:cytochrome c-type biogenesis protein CcmH
MMTWFWVLAIFLGAVAAGFVLIPFFMKAGTVGKTLKNDARDLVNVDLYEERLAELNAQLGDNTIDQQEFEQIQAELQRNLLDDTPKEAASGHGGRAPIEGTIEATRETKRLTVVLALLVPLLAIFAYADFGLSWGAITDLEIAREVRSGDPGNEAEMRSTLAKLAKQLARQPDNVDGLFMLGQSYLSLAEYEKAADVFADLSEKFSDDAGLASYYAESLYLAEDKKLTPSVEKAIDKALTLNPEELTMLEIKGMDAFQRADLHSSLEYFSTALGVAGGARAEMIRAVIARIESQLEPVEKKSKKNLGAGTKKASRSLQVLVELADSVVVEADAAVFVYAKAIEGPPAPLAVQKVAAGSLPTLIKLDESMAMMQGMGLADFDRVQVIARISSSGTVDVSPDDYEARTETIDISTQTSAVKITIGKKIKDQ